MVDLNNDWRDVPGYEGLYKVHRDGRVLSMGREIEGVRRGTPCIIRYKQKLMTPQTSRKHPTPSVQLNKGNGAPPQKPYVADLVRAAFGE